MKKLVAIITLAMVSGTSASQWRWEKQYPAERPREDQSDRWNKTYRIETQEQRDTNCLRACRKEGDSWRECRQRCGLE